MSGSASGFDAAAAFACSRRCARPLLVDRNEIARWVNLEIASWGLTALGKFPSEGELRAVTRRDGS